jgi:MYXO-CTERM domain-containing protein
VSVAAIACVLAGSLAGPVAADSGPAARTFAQIVGEAKLIVVARIDIGPDGGVTLDVERVLKGTAGARLVFPPTDIAPPLEDWKRAVVAFTDPATIDFRAPTIAWHVADDGTIDPEGYQRYPGLPRTLDSMLVACGQDAIESDAAPVAAPLATQAPLPDDPPPALPVVIAGAAAIGLAALILIARRRRAQSPAVRPKSIEIAAPVIGVARSETRNAINSATSSGRMNRGGFCG